MSIADEIEKLRELNKHGVINSWEFETKKKRLLKENDYVPIADELRKLEDLRKSGVIKTKEFDSKKKQLLKPAKGRRYLWLHIPVAIVAGILLINSLLNMRGSAGLPTCESSAAKAAVGNAFEMNAAANVETLKLLDLISIKEISADEKARRCYGIAVLNAGQRPINFRLWKASNGRMLLVEVD